MRWQGSIVGALLVCACATGGTTPEHEHESTPISYATASHPYPTLRLVYDLDAEDLERRLGIRLQAWIADRLATAPMTRVELATDGSSTVQVGTTSGHESEALIHTAVAGWSGFADLVECPPGLGGHCFVAGTKLRNQVREDALVAAETYVGEHVVPLGILDVKISNDRLVVTVGNVSADELAAARLVIETRPQAKVRIVAGDNPRWTEVAGKVFTNSPDAAVTTERFGCCIRSRQGDLSREVYLEAADTSPDGWRRIAKVLAWAGFVVDAEHEIVYGRSDRGWRAFHVRRIDELTGDDIAAVGVQWYRQGAVPIVVVTMTMDGSRRLAKLTFENFGRQIAFLVDGDVFITPSIRRTISDGKMMFTLGDRREKNLENRSRALARGLWHSRDSVRLAEPEILTR